jgi:DNA-binding NtrC family response regulator
MFPRPESTVLVVDDEEDTASLLSELLQKRGYRSQAFTSGSECLEYLRNEVADVVITDVQMPGMTGIELCRELRLRHPELLSIVLTGIVDIKRALAAVRAGAHELIVKPVRLEMLELAITRALEDRERRRRDARTEHRGG